MGTVAFRTLCLSWLLSSRVVSRALALDNNLPFKHLTEADGLPDPTVRCFTQDRSGAIWIGTGKGINRYVPATNRLQSYPETDPGGGSFYWDLLVSRQGTVWAASTGGASPV